VELVISTYKLEWYNSKDCYLLFQIGTVLQNIQRCTDVAYIALSMRTVLIFALLGTISIYSLSHLQFLSSVLL